MAIRFDKIKAGMTLYDVHRYKVDHAKMTKLGTWPVYIVSVNPDAKTAVVRWNGNSEQRYNQRSLERLRANKPLAK